MSMDTTAPPVSVLVWNQYANIIGELLRKTQVTDAFGLQLDIDMAFNTLCDASLALRQSSGELFFVGNGASASIASHCAADVLKHAHIRTNVFTDVSLLSAMGNDAGYANVFTLPLATHMRTGDMLIAISSSGTSTNILHAVQCAREMGGQVVTLSAFASNNPLRSMGHWNFYVDAPSYGWAESCHASILHYWMDMMHVARGQHGRP